MYLSHVAKSRHLSSSPWHRYLSLKAIDLKGVGQNCNCCLLLFSFQFWHFCKMIATLLRELMLMVSGRGSN